MQREEEQGTADAVVVRSCPTCPLRNIITKSTAECYHMKCPECQGLYCGVCGFQNINDSWVRGHSCVDGNNISANSPMRRSAIFRAYEEALKTTLE